MIGVNKAVSRNRTFNRVTDAQIEELKKEQIPKRSFSKLKWGVRAYREMREHRLGNEHGYDDVIFQSNIDKLHELVKDKFEYSMCRFVAEVRKKKGKGQFPGRTLYQLCVAIQSYLKKNKIFWKLVDSPDFVDLKTVLDNVMKQRAQANIGVVTKQAQLISYEHENQMWNDGILGEETADQLRDTVLFLLRINLALRAGDKHHQLRRTCNGKESQLVFQRNDSGDRCLVYYEDTCTKTNNGGLKHMRKERKVVWIFPNKSDVTRCMVRLVDKYLGLCPPKTTKTNFYLRSLEKCNPGQWYANQVLGQHKIQEVVKNLLKNAKLDGFFTNHSLRRSGTTRLFQAGVSRKLIKEFTGHSSDAVDKYSITSEEQRESISKIIAAKPNPVSSPCEVSKKKGDEGKLIVQSNGDVQKECCKCDCKKLVEKHPEVLKVCQVINEIVESKRSGKTVIRMEIEISHE